LNLSKRQGSKQSEEVKKTGNLSQKPNDTLDNDSFVSKTLD
jgi:hypothetical protein